MPASPRWVPTLSTTWLTHSSSTTDGAIPLALVEIRRNANHRPAEFIQGLKADVVVLDVSLPYAVNWYFAELLALALPIQAMVLTTGNRVALESALRARFPNLS